MEVEIPITDHNFKVVAQLADIFDMLRHIYLNIELDLDSFMLSKKTQGWRQSQQSSFYP